MLCLFLKMCEWVRESEWPCSGIMSEFGAIHTPIKVLVIWNSARPVRFSRNLDTRPALDKMRVCNPSAPECFGFRTCEIKQVCDTYAQAPDELHTSFFPLGWCKFTAGFVWKIYRIHWIENEWWCLTLFPHAYNTRSKHILDYFLFDSAWSNSH
jgi:hypothetical protein